MPISATSSSVVDGSTSPADAHGIDPVAAKNSSRRRQNGRKARHRRLCRKRNGAAALFQRQPITARQTSPLPSLADHIIPPSRYNSSYPHHNSADPGTNAWLDPRHDAESTHAACWLYCHAAETLAAPRSRHADCPLAFPSARHPSSISGSGVMGRLPPRTLSMFSLASSPGSR